MAVELLGAKMLAPFFGSSLYVWTTTLAMTLGALTSGYFVGGLLSVKPQRTRLLLLVLLISAALIGLMPLSAGFLLNIIPLGNLWLGLFLAGLFILFPPIFFLGMVSPLIIAELSAEIDAPGKAAGMIYAISTLGGILYTFLFGFWVIPAFGLSLPAVLSGLVLAVLTCFFLNQRRRLTTVLGILAASLCLLPFAQVAADPRRELKILSLREGLLGQVMVSDYQEPGSQLKRRHLLVNRVIQTEYTPAASEPYSRYAHRLSQFAQAALERDSALVLGLGGGAVSNLLLRKAGFHQVDACEFDRRIYEAAQQFFGLDPRVNVTIDDARYHLRQIKTKYSLVVFDLFRGEESPEHVLTLESLEQLKTNLSSKGLVFINSHGFVSGAAGNGNRSLIRTLKKAGYIVHLFATNPQEVSSNLLILAALEPETLEPVLKSATPDLTPIALPDMAQTYLLTDNHPVLNVLNTQASASWRKAYLQDMFRYREQGLPVFR
ncbi:MAG: fused MFS/spermidine synthase [Candidatus Sericytochromatia bacterium]